MISDQQSVVAIEPDVPPSMAPLDVSSKVGAPLTLKMAPGGIIITSQLRRNLSTSYIENQLEQSKKLRKLSIPAGHSSRYKTEKCRSYVDSGYCKYGDKCQFAHGNRELRLLSRHPRFKTELCRTFHSTGFCPYGPRCHFIHSESDRLDYDLSNEDVLEMWQQQFSLTNPSQMYYNSSSSNDLPMLSPTATSPQPSLSSNGSFDSDSAFSPTPPPPQFSNFSPIDDLVSEIDLVLRNHNENFCPATPGSKRLPIFSRLTTSQ